MAIKITVNGQTHSLDVEPDTPLLWTIRETLGLTGTKFGCGISACGACTVTEWPSRPFMSVSGFRRRRRAVTTTIEGLAREGILHKVQQAWITYQVPQCGYCQSGMIMAVAALSRAAPASERRGHRRRDHQHLSLRNVRPRETAPFTPSHSVNEEAVVRKWTRRAFIGAGSLVGGGFVLGAGGLLFAPNRQSVVSADAAEKGELTTWITVTPDDLVTVLVPHCEMGQGTHTALAMMAAEEMDADWNLVRVREAPALDAYANAYMLRPSLGDHPRTARAGRGLGRVSPGALVRHPDDWRLLGRSRNRAIRHDHGRRRCPGDAARRGCRTLRRQDCRIARQSDRVSSMRASGKSASFGELATAAATIPVPSIRRLKHPDAYTIRRTARPRLDIPSKVDGSAIYGIDFTLPGMLHAAIEIAPVYGGKLTSVDTTPAEAMPGVKRVVRLDEAVAVVADTYWHARRALAALKPAFDDAGHGSVSSASIFAAFDKSLGAPPEMPKNAARPSPPTTASLSGACDDGADGVHGACGRRSRRGLGGRPGSTQCQERGGERAQAERRAGAPHQPAAWRRVRPPSSVHIRLH